MACSDLLAIVWYATLIFYGIAALVCGGQPYIIYRMARAVLIMEGVAIILLFCMGRFP